MHRLSVGHVVGSSDRISNSCSLRTISGVFRRWALREGVPNSNSRWRHIRMQVSRQDIEVEKSEWPTISTDLFSQYDVNEFNHFNHH